MTTLYSSPTTEEKVPASAPDVQPDPMESKAASEPEEEMAAEPEGNLQQTRFAEDIVLNALTTKPHPTESTDPTHPRQAVAPVSPKRKFLPVMIGLVIALFFITAVSIFMPRNDMGSVLPTPTPAAQAEQATQLSALERELLLLEKDIEAADPLQAKLAFPPVDFTFVLEDATVLQAEQQRGSRR